MAHTQRAVYEPALLAEIRRRLETPPSDKLTILAVDGCGGAGKSILAEELSRVWGTEVVHTDDFASADIPIEWWPRMISELLEPLRTRGRATFVKHCWVTNGPGEAQTVVGPKVVIEGVSSSRREFRPFITLSVWVETPRDVRLRRGLDRDGAEAASQWNEWMRQEDAYVIGHRPQLAADLVVCGVTGRLLASRPRRRGTFSGGGPGQRAE